MRLAAALPDAMEQSERKRSRATFEIICSALAITRPHASEQEKREFGRIVVEIRKRGAQSKLRCFAFAEHGVEPLRHGPLRVADKFKQAARKQHGKQRRWTARAHVLQIAQRPIEMFQLMEIGVERFSRVGKRLAQCFVRIVET